VNYNNKKPQREKEVQSIEKVDKDSPNKPV
jgi:hypothetical protein